MILNIGWGFRIPSFVKTASLEPCSKEHDRYRFGVIRSLIGVPGVILLVGRLSIPREDFHVHNGEISIVPRLRRARVRHMPCVSTARGGALLIRWASASSLSTKQEVRFLPLFLLVLDSSHSVRCKRHQTGFASPFVPLRYHRTIPVRLPFILPFQTRTIRVCPWWVVDHTSKKGGIRRRTKLSASQA